MNLSQLKEIYKKANNINLVNTIIEVEEMNEKYGISINKIITYLISNCTSKIKRKNLSTLETYYPYNGELTLEEVNCLNNKNICLTAEDKFNYLKDENENLQNITKIQKYKNSSYKKQKSVNNINNEETKSEQKNEKSTQEIQ